MDRLITIYTAKSRKAQLWARTQLTWPELRGRLLDFAVTPETYDEYVTMTRDRQTAVKDVGGFVGGTLRDGIRKKTHMESRSVVTLDYDEFSPGQLEKLRDALPGVCWVVYSTHKHTARAWRVRVVIPLSEDVDPEKYEALSRKVAEMIGMAGIDRTTFEPVRMMFWPSRSCDADYVAEANDTGDLLRPNALLNLYDDWRDPAQWPRTADEADLFSTANVPTSDPRTLEIWRNLAVGAGAKPTRQGSGMADPTKKEGVVGAFCRTYTMTAAIERFLGGMYKPYRPGRWTYLNGSTVGGVVVYDDRWMYSNHATDPLGGRELNAWDAVRLGLFGTLDRGHRAASVMALPSSAEMVKLALADPDVSRLMAEETARRAAEAFADVELTDSDGDQSDRSDQSDQSDRSDRSDSDDWAEREARLRNKKGDFELTRMNLRTVLLHHPEFRGRLRFNEFTDQMEVHGRLPWRRIQGALVNDADTAYLRAWFEETYKAAPKEKLDDAMQMIKGPTAYHPVREYMDALEWDGVPRLDGLLVNLLGADDTELNRTLTALMFVAAVARVHEPGVKYDICVTLFGPEGCGKSTLIGAMSRPWFVDSAIRIGEKDGMSALRGRLMVELAEMASLKRADLDMVKNFISSQSDVYRPAYARHDVEVPRQCVFVATTNDRYCLRGFGDNRRFPVVEVNPERRRMDVDVADYVGEWRDQLWAEAVSLWRGGFRLFLPPHLDREARRIGSEHSLDQNCAMFDDLDRYLEMELPDNWRSLDRATRRQWLAGQRPAGVSSDLEPRRQVCCEEILTECFDMRKDNPKYNSRAREVAAYMDRKYAGKWEKVYSILRDSVFGRPKGWRKNVSEEEEDVI